MFAFIHFFGACLRRLIGFSCLVAVAFLMACAPQNLPQRAFVHAQKLADGIGPGSVLRVVVRGEDDLSGTYHVDENGDIKLPLIGALSVRGMEAKDAALAITRAYKQGYLKDPDIKVSLVGAGVYFVLGDVKAPGSYAWHKGDTVMQALSQAGGFVPYSGGDEIGFVVIRGGHALDVLSGKVLRAGDVLYVRGRAL